MLYESGLPKERCYFVMPENLELATKLVSDSRIDFFSFIGSSITFRRMAPMGPISGTAIPSTNILSAPAFPVINVRPERSGTV